MAATVFLHIGLPKTATTYLQTILWGNEAVLAEQGLLLPGPERRYHYWCTRIVRGDAAFAERANPRQLAAWDTVRAADRGLAGHRDRQSRVLRRGDAGAGRADGRAAVLRQRRGGGAPRGDRP